MSNMTVATEILRQLGGNRFVAMTGAKGLVGGDSSLTFSIGRGAKNRANKVRVTLTDRDDYTVEFFSYRNLDLKPVGKVEGVYCDTLRAAFTNATGFEVAL